VAEMLSEELLEESKSQKTSSCFYTLCDKSVCCRVFPWGTFKDKKHSVYCYLITALITSLLVAVIVPLVCGPFFSCYVVLLRIVVFNSLFVCTQLLYWLADWQINVFMVVDSTDAHNYDSWQNNVYGTGAKVCSS
jgi:hypothetical protein